MGKKAKITAKVSTNNGKAVKPSLGRGTGGLFTAKIVADVRKRRKNKSNG